MSEPHTAGAREPLWMTLALKIIAAVDLTRGAVMIVFPSTFLALAGIDTTTIRASTQALGFYSILIGGYLLIAAFAPRRHWPAPVLSLAAKMFVPALILTSFARAGLQPPTGFLLTVYVIWWIPLAIVIWSLLDAASRSAQAERVAAPTQALMEVAEDQSGRSLQELTTERPHLVVFLRHFGCTFCRETLADLVDRRHDIEAHGLGIALIHMGDETEAAAFLSHYGLDDLSRIADPGQHLYRAARLHRGSLWQLLGPKVWWRALAGGALREHGVGRLLGDGFQMPGAFVVSEGQVLYEFRHRSAADRPDYLELARCGISGTPSRAA
jgi:peroxiredoxin